MNAKSNRFELVVIGSGPAGQKGAIADRKEFASYAEQRQSKILRVRIGILQIITAITFLMEAGSKLAGVKMIVNAFEQISGTAFARNRHGKRGD